MSQAAHPKSAPFSAPGGTATAPPRAVRPAAWALVGIALATLLVYARALGGEFVYDDLLVIQRNPLITSLANLPEIFSSSYWDFLDGEARSLVGYYRPLTMALLTLCWQVGDGEAWAFHLLSILVHALASIAAALFVARLAQHAAVGAFAGLLFALHPLHVESTAWISALNDPLAAAFGFLALIAFLDWRGRGARGVPWAAGMWLLPALLSKDAALAVIPIALALDLGRRRLPGEPQGGALAGLRPLARAYAPFAVAFLVYYLMRVAVFGSPWAGFERTTTDFGVGFGRLLLLRFELLAGFSWLALWPADLDLFRPFRPDLGLSDPPIQFALLFSFLVLGACALVLVRRLRPLAALVWILPASLVPVLLRVEAVGTFPLSDRFLYMGVVGLTGALSWLAFARLPKQYALVLLSLLALGYGLRSYARLGFWQSEEAMFETAIEQNPDDPRSYWSLGRVRLQGFRHTGDLAQLEAARQLFDEGMALIEQDSRGELGIYVTRDDALQMNLGQAWTYFFMAGSDPYSDYDTPKELFEKIVRVFPESERGHTGLGATLLRLGQHDAAAAALRVALKINERSVEAHHDMGQLLRILGDLEGAERHFRRAMELRQDDFNDMMGLAQTLFARGDLDGAADLALRAQRAHPQYAGPLALMGTISNASKRWADALRWFEQALELAPDAGELHFERAQALAVQGRTAESIPSYTRAFELRGGDFQVAYQYGRALLIEGRADAAVRPLVRAYLLRPANPIGERLHEELRGLRQDDLTLQWNLASVSAQREEWELASEWCHRALDLDPDHGPTHFLLGLVNRGLDRPEEARLAFTAALNAMPDHYTSHVELASVLSVLERPDEAARILTRALELLQIEPMPEERRAGERARLEAQLELLLSKED